MLCRKKLNILAILAWLLLVLICFIILSTNYSDFTARAQVAEGFSLASGLKGSVADFYETYGRCPTSGEIKDITNYKGNYVEQIYLAEIAGSNFCYLVAKLNNNPTTDKRVRGKSLVLVMQPALQWQAEVSCQIGSNIEPASCINTIKQEW